MTDNEIIELYWQRSERAVAETERKYGRYCLKIAQNILNDIEDSKECVNDAFLSAWNAIPPTRPNVFSAFLAKITRNHAMNLLKRETRQKRGKGETALLLSELSECVPSKYSAEEYFDERYLGEVLGEFLKTLSEVNRAIFVERYFYCRSIAEIAKMSGFSGSKITSILFRTREKLKLALYEKGIEL